MMNCKYSIPFTTRLPVDFEQRLLWMYQIQSMVATNAQLLFRECSEESFNLPEVIRSVEDDNHRPVIILDSLPKGLE